MSGIVLVVGSGGREHALARELALSARKVYIAPGNAGTSEVGENVPISPMDFPAIIRFVEKHGVDLTVVGPDAPIAAGIADAFGVRRLPIFAPSRNAAVVESSKVSTKFTLLERGIPTAPGTGFYSRKHALAHVRSRSTPFVVKADGPARGKGVFVCATAEEAEEVVRKLMYEHTLGDAGDKVVVEDCLFGTEFSVHALCGFSRTQGACFDVFPLSQDHKRLLEGDKGPMTGGMGAVAPLPHADAESMIKKVKELIIAPLLRELAAQKRPFVGLLYPGIMATEDGPKALEFNARFGDPEAQVYLPLLASNLSATLSACARGELSSVTPLSWRSGYVTCVVLASGGYPGAYKTGAPITGIKEAARLRDVYLFHAGTAYDESGHLVTDGGRVLGVSAFGVTMQDSIERAYEAVRHIYFPGMYYRRDIGYKALQAVI